MARCRAIGINVKQETNRTNSVKFGKISGSKLRTREIGNSGQNGRTLINEQTPIYDEPISQISYRNQIEAVDSVNS